MARGASLISFILHDLGESAVSHSKVSPAYPFKTPYCDVRSDVEAQDLHAVAHMTRLIFSGYAK